MEKKESFEEKSIRLEKIVEKLENDKSLSLDETTALFKEGKKLVAALTEEISDLKKLVSNEIVTK